MIDLKLFHLFVATYYTISRYIYLKDSGESKDIVWNFATSIDDFKRNETTWLVVGKKQFELALK